MDFEKLVAELILTPEEKDKLKEDFEFNLLAEQEEFDRIVTMNTPVCCRGSRCSG